MAPMALGQTIAVVDKSGKVISTSKTLLSVFKEAKAAYRERKAEIVAERQIEADTKQARRALRQFNFDDRRSAAAPSEGDRKSKSRSRQRRTVENLTTTTKIAEGHRQRERREDDDTLTLVGDGEAGHTAGSRRRREFVHRHTTQEDQDGVTTRRRRRADRSASYPGPDVDMDLAYGELPPPKHSSGTAADEKELKSLMIRTTTLLDEAHCVQHSVSKMIATLQKDPDALAAVALTLAEISNVVAKTAPAALTAMKGSFPAVFALLASPQFLIAAGVGVGVVIVALGGYKIIKKIRARNSDDDDNVDELQEIDLDVEVDRIDAWRRGVTDIDIASVTTSIDGEFITPEAAAIRRAEGFEPRMRSADHLVEDRGRGVLDVGGSRRRKETRRSSRRTNAANPTKTTKDLDGEKKKKKKNKRNNTKEEKSIPSTLRLLFR